MDTKQTKVEKLTLKIGGHSIELQSKVTSLRKVKTVVNSYFSIFNLDKKETEIVLPNGTKLKFSDLNNVKSFARVIFPAQFLDGSNNAENLEFLKNVAKIQAVAYAMPIDWGLVGTKDGAQILNLYKLANKKAIELEVLPKNVKLIGDGK